MLVMCYLGNVCTWRSRCSEFFSVPRSCLFHPSWRPLVLHAVNVANLTWTQHPGMFWSVVCLGPPRSLRSSGRLVAVAVGNRWRRSVIHGLSRCEREKRYSSKFRLVVWCKVSDCVGSSLLVFFRQHVLVRDSVHIIFTGLFLALPSINLHS